MSLEFQRVGLYQVSEPYMKDFLRSVDGKVIANSLKTTFNNLQKTTGISIPAHNVDRVVQLIESNSAAAAKLMLSHSTPDWRTLGSAQQMLRDRARFYASIDPNAKPKFIPVFQADTQDPVFSVTTCGNCDEAVMATIGVTTAAFGLAAAIPGVVCPARALAAGILGFIGAEIVLLLTLR